MKNFVITQLYSNVRLDASRVRTEDGRGARSAHSWRRNILLSRKFSYLSINPIGVPGWCRPAPAAMARAQSAVY